MLNVDFLFCFSFAVAFLFPSVSASIYPTQPIQATVWSADQPTMISWVDDWKYPTLDVMGPFNVLLYWDTETYLMELASGVDPQSKSVQVTVPRSVLRNGSKYTLRFTTDKPSDIVIFSADFMIIPANTSTSTLTNTNTASGSGAAGAANTSGGTQSSPNATKTGSKTTSSNGTATTAYLSRTAIPSGILPPPGPIPGGQAPVQEQRKNAGRRSVDIEKFKFRLVFVIWPVLMGITMAL